MTEQTVAPIPAHVPAELVRYYPLSERKTIYENPFDTLVADVHNTWPEIAYGSNVYPGNVGAWVLRRAEDLKAVYMDEEHFTKKGFSGFAALLGESWSLIPTELEPPRHGAFRQVLNPLFAPRRMAELTVKVRDRARELAARFKGRTECDFAAEFAVPFPAIIFLELFGLPQAEMDHFLAWEHKLLHVADQTVRADATREVKHFLQDVIKERRKNLGTDLISNAIQITIDGEPITDDEILGHCFNLYVGGLDTVASNLGLHFHHLATHPEHQQQLRDNPALIPAAMEEMLRAYSAVTTFRICTKQTEIHGVSILPGDKVAMTTPLAGRDPTQYKNPNEVRFDRGATHVTFGYGSHRCLGANLARRELLIALEEVLAVLPPFRLAPGAVVPFRAGGVIHVESLPLVWG
ncbi:MAG: Cytochrome [Verrucomicrobiaceae bacterium]|nr:Cytochrome [Verrucomicrobiaceae bacterium]